MRLMKQSKTSGEFFDAIYRIVATIPAGKVMTYGQLALLAGRPRAARIVGYAMARAPEGRSLPCHRVVNRLGKMAPGDIFGGAGVQRMLLESEGITFLPDGRIDMKAHIVNYTAQKEHTHEQKQ
jgi:methylated-DNA-protein-cysteine methyltransferase-like protein